METDQIFLYLAIIVFAAKILEAVSRKIKQPPVIGLLFLGIILGPTFLEIVPSNEIIAWIAKIGVLFLLFEAGLETDIKKIKAESKQALLPALGGVLFPFLFGFVLAFLFLKDHKQAMIIGVIFTATSVSVSVMSLLEMKKMKSLEGRCIVNAAIIDDVVGILLLTIIFGFLSEEGMSQNIIFSLAKIIIFFAVSILIGIFVLRPFFLNLKKILLDNAVISLTIAIVLLYAWFAEITGLAAITGAYFAGLFLGQTPHKNSIHKGITIIGKSFFIDVFFVNIGLQFNLMKMETNLCFLLGFVILAILGKILGSSLGAMTLKYDLVRSFRIGSGMVPRGEVALIVANMALDKGFIHRDVLSATIMMVIFSAIVTPFLLKFSFINLGKKSFE